MVLGTPNPTVSVDAEVLASFPNARQTVSDYFEAMFKSIRASENCPSDKVFFINPRYTVNGDLDMDATAAASAVIENVGTEKENPIGKDNHD